MKLSKAGQSTAVVKVKSSIKMSEDRAYLGELVLLLSVQTHGDCVCMKVGVDKFQQLRKQEASTNRASKVMARGTKLMSHWPVDSPP